MEYPVSKDEIAEAREKMNALEYLERYEPQELVRVSNTVYTTRAHDSLKIKADGRWYWWSRKIGGHTALDYLVEVKGLSLPDAVYELTGKGKPPGEKGNEKYKPPARATPATFAADGFNLYPRRGEHRNYRKLRQEMLFVMKTAKTPRSTIFLRYLKFVIVTVILCLSGLVAYATGAAGGTNPLTTINNLSDFVFSAIRAIGIILLGWGVVQIGMSLQSHDPSQRTNGFLTFFGGLVIAFAKEILTLIGVV